MIRFNTSGTLPATWEGFLSLTPGVPDVSIIIVAVIADKNDTAGGAADD